MTYFIDLDGTLINSFYRHYYLLEKILKEKKINIKLDKNDYFYQKTNGKNNLRYLKENLKLDKELAEEIAKKWQNNIETYENLELDTLYEDTIPFLEKIKSNKIIFLTARKNEKGLQKELKKLNLINYIHSLIIVSPQNAMLEKSKYINNYKNTHHKEQICIIGDTENEYFTGKNNDIKYYILNRGFRSKKFLNKFCYTYNNLNEIYERMENEKL